MSHKDYIVNKLLAYYLIYISPTTYTLKPLSLLHFTSLAFTIDPGTHQMLVWPHSTKGLPTDNARDDFQSKI